MIRSLVLLAAIGFAAASVQAQVSIQSLTGNSYTQDFNTLLTTGTANTWANNETLPGWYADRESGGPVTTYRASTGDQNAGALYSFGIAGVASSEDRALGSISSGTPQTIAYGLRLLNDTADAVTNLVVSYTGEQWRNGGNASAQPLAFSYRVANSALTNSQPATNEGWTLVPELAFTSLVGSTTAAALDGNDPANRTVFTGIELTGIALQPGEELFLRWRDVNDAGNDHGFGVDDFSLTFTRYLAPVLPPEITAEPVSITTTPLMAASFSVTVKGTPPLSYQWYRGDTALSGETNATYSLASVRHADAGNYSVVITNVAGAVTSAVASLTVEGFAVEPIANTNTLTATAVQVPLVFVDALSPITDIATASANPALLPDANIVVSGTGNNRTLTLTPAAGANGVAVVTVTSSDGAVSVAKTFALVVVPGSYVLFNDSFDYTAGAATTNSAFVWNTHSGAIPGETLVVANQLYVSRSLTEDLSATFIGAPPATNSGAALYSKFTVNFNELPTTNGAYFAHFKDAGINFRGRIWSSVDQAEVGKFRLGIGNGSESNARTAQFPLDLELNTPYTIVTRHDLATGASTLWINPTAESSTSVTAADSITNLVVLSAYAFRQNSGAGKTFVDDLVIGTSFGAVTGGEVPVSLTVTRNGENVILTWPDVSYTLQSSTEATGTYTPVEGATSPYSTTAAGDRRFYQLKK